MRKPFYASAVRPLLKPARVHDVNKMIVFAVGPELARAAVGGRYPDAVHISVKPAADDGGELVFSTGHYTLTPAELRQLKGEPEPVKPEPKRKGSRPLGEAQIECLRSLDAHKRFLHGHVWVWNTYSGTIRILDTLVKRKLADKDPDTGKYTISKKGLQAIGK